MSTTTTTTTTTFRTGTADAVEVSSRMLNVYNAVESGATIKEAGEAQGYKGGAASAAVAKVRELIDADATIVIKEDAAHPYEGDAVEGGTVKALDRMTFAESINPALPVILGALDTRRADADALNKKALKLETEAKAMRERADKAYADVVGTMGPVLNSLGVDSLDAFEADYLAAVEAQQSEGDAA